MKNHKDTFWVWIIIFLPLVGGLSYVIVEIIPMYFSKNYFYNLASDISSSRDNQRNNERKTNNQQIKNSPNENLGFDYICQYCGRSATFGSHFCKGSNKKNYRFGLNITIPRYLIYLFIATVLITPFLFKVYRGKSLYVLLLIPSIIILKVIFSALIDRIKQEKYRELLSLVGFDRKTAERLIEMESKRNASLSREQCIQAAIDRLINDRSRV